MTTTEQAEYDALCLLWHATEPMTAEQTARMNELHEKTMPKKVEIFSHGGGTQSAAITALIVQGKLPKPDFVCIVDTERERQSTWDYLDAVIRPALASVGLEVHRIRKSEWATVDWMGGKSGNDVLMPVWSSQTEKEAKLPGFCSNEWKVRVQQRFCRKVLGVASKQQRRWIGFSLDESRRAVRMMKGEEYQAGLIRFPLIHDVPLRRQAAIAVVEKMGWPTPPRSACWMCPNQGDHEWRDLKANSPAEFAAACALEKEVQKKDPFAWFHSSCVPLGQVDFTAPDDLFADRACSSGGCFT
jgi:hypothetical protein